MKRFTNSVRKCISMSKSQNVPTMKDVAREAGVSLGTVSKVMNGITVGESYRKRVTDAAEKLGYQINSYARGLKTNKTYSVAVILPDLEHPFFAAFGKPDKTTLQLIKALSIAKYKTINDEGGSVTDMMNEFNDIINNQSVSDE